MSAALLATTMTTTTTMASASTSRVGVGKQQNKIATKTTTTAVRRLPKRHVACAGAVEASGATASATQADMDALWEWLSSSGVDVSGVVPRMMDDTPGGRGWGLVAAKNLGANESALSIPKALWMTYETATASPVGPFCEGQLPWVAVALQLLHEKAIGKKGGGGNAERSGGGGGGSTTTHTHAHPHHSARCQLPFSFASIVSTPTILAGGKKKKTRCKGK